MSPPDPKASSNKSQIGEIKHEVIDILLIYWIGSADPLGGPNNQKINALATVRNQKCLLLIRKRALIKVKLVK
jgi:hypothetical protein